jgi:periplasmic protein CpxP/Spy
MKTLKFYKILVIVLVLLNATTLFFLWRAPHHPPHHGPRKSLVEIIDLEGEAASKIKKLEDVHFRDKDALISESRQLHEKLFRSFNDEDKDSSDIHQLIDRIVENQRETEQMTFDYFKEVDALCNEEQKVKLQEVIHHALGRMGMPPPPPKH